MQIDVTLFRSLAKEFRVIVAAVYGNVKYGQKCLEKDRTGQFDPVTMSDG